MKWNKHYLFHFDLLHCVYQFRKCSNKKQLTIIIWIVQKIIFRFVFNHLKKNNPFHTYKNNSLYSYHFRLLFINELNLNFSKKSFKNLQSFERGNSKSITTIRNTSFRSFRAIHNAYYIIFRIRNFFLLFLFFFSSSLNVVLDVGTYGVPLSNESCAAYFGETEFAIARESGRQWPASAARDQAVCFAWLQHCTVKGQTQSNARMHDARLHVTHLRCQDIYDGDEFK